MMPVSASPPTPALLFSCPPGVPSLSLFSSRSAVASPRASCVGTGVRIRLPSTRLRMVRVKGWNRGLEGSRRRCSEALRLLGALVASRALAVWRAVRRPFPAAPPGLATKHQRRHLSRLKRRRYRGRQHGLPGLHRRRRRQQPARVHSRRLPPLHSAHVIDAFDDEGGAVMLVAVMGALVA